MSFKKEAIKQINLFADLMEFNGANSFKINAFRGAANTLRSIDEDIESMLHDGSITNIKGIGKGIQAFLYDLSDNGIVKELDELSVSIPEGIIDILQIRGLGVKKVKLIYETLGVKNINDLAEVCLSNKLSEVKGFTVKSEYTILDEIEKQSKNKLFMRYNRAEHLGAQLINKLLEFESCLKVEFTGEIRRKMEVISKIEIIYSVNSRENFKSELINLYKYNELDGDGSIKIMQVEMGANIPVYLILTDEKDYYSTLFTTTGSAEFMEKIDAIDDENFENEEQIFDTMNIPFIIPEMREQEYWNAPEQFRTNSNLVKDNFNGMLHFHTTQSDGANTLLEMAKGALDFGYKYLAVCDHSKSAFYANGLTEERVLKQKDEIKLVSNKLGIKIYHGVESDILKDGSLDYSDEFLHNFDFLVASVHSIFGLTEEEMTSRIIKAIENPHTDVLGHPTGRLLLARDSYKLNIEKVIEACAKNDVAIEINASPHRLDLDWRNIYFARELGCKFAINPDAHSVKGIEETLFGINIARKGGIQKNEVINCYSEEKFEEYLTRKINRII
ncbi:MAG: DNA polymerase/3'-5' exonuclease PolX [Melioribacteraceae bacterium]|jgi:DNA polymerase (family 10)|nr:DNA polymerase/3'-5' exonuclease PolX [Melioribacteraceae bacterium]